MLPPGAQPPADRILRTPPGAEEARTGYETARAIHREVGNLAGKGKALADLTDLSLSQNHMEEARRYLDGAVSMLEHHVVCIQEPTEVFGARVAQYLDPDGLAISVGEERRSG